MAWSAIMTSLKTGHLKSVKCGQIGSTLTVVTYYTGNPVAGGAAGGFVAGFIASGGNFRAGLSGAAMGAAMGYFGGLNYSGGALEKGAVEGVVGGAISEADGGSFRAGFTGAFVSAAISSPLEGDISGESAGAVAERTVIAAVAGGTVSEIDGGSFANGAWSAAFQQLFNEAEHAVTVKVLAKGKVVEIIYADGSVEVRVGGSMSWRNNNPGNLRPTKFSYRHGAIGKNGGFAVFPNAALGKAALAALLRTSTYKSLTLNGAISRYAPPSENNTSAYQNFVRHQTGLGGNSSMSTLTDAQINSVVNAIQVHEHWTSGDVLREHLWPL